jgi:hypothetical protein
LKIDAQHRFTKTRHTPRKRSIQYAAAFRFIFSVSGILDRPVKPGDDSSDSIFQTAAAVIASASEAIHRAAK